MPRLLLLATTTGYQTRAFGEAAGRLGVELVFATDRCLQLDDPWQDRAIPIRFHDEDGSVEAIVRAARSRPGAPIDGVLAVGDRPTVIAARAAAALGLPGHPPEAADVSRHKRRMRERFRAAGLPTPWFVPAPLDLEARALAPPSFPCVVKPVALSASRGVMRADDHASLAAAWERLRALMSSPEIRAEREAAHGLALIEEFIPGREFAIEGLLHHGELHVLAIFDKPDPLDGPFFEETIYLTPSSTARAVQRSIVDAVRRACAAMGLHHGPIHAECRVNERGVFVLEVAARPIGGLCARVLRFETPTRASRIPDPGSRIPVPFEDLLVRHALGESPEGWRREAVAAGVMMIPIPRGGVFRGVEGVEAARAVPGVEDVRMTAKVEQRLVPLPEGASYLGFIFARAGRAADVDHALRVAHDRLRFAIDPEIPVLAVPQVHYNSRHG